MWDLPGSGLEPVFPELAGGFLTTAPPGRSVLVFNISKLEILADMANSLGSLVETTLGLVSARA